MTTHNFPMPVVEKQQPLAEERVNVHSPVFPADVRMGEPIHATLVFQGRAVACRTWRMSPLGIELIPQTDIDLAVGVAVDINLVIGTSQVSVRGVKVCDRWEEKGKRILAFRTCIIDTAPRPEDVERRINARWSTNSEFMPTGVAPNPAKFNDYIFFRIRDLSSSGMSVLTSLRNKYLVQGMKLRTTITLPLVGTVELYIEIMNVRIVDENSKPMLALGCRFVTPSRGVLEAIGQYIFQFGPATSISELKSAGLYVVGADKLLDFRYVRTEEEYKQVLELRKKAYSEVGKLAEGASVADIYDTRSRIIIGVYKGRVIASTRLIYNDIDDQMEHEQFVAFPPDFPRRDDVCEITRVCTDPDFRGSDILLGLFRFVAITVVQSGRKHILGCATEDLLPLYLKLGFQNSGLSYEHKDLNNKKHFIFMGDVAKGLSGYNVNPVVWNVVWGDVTKYIQENGVYEFDSVAGARMRLYQWFRPISLFLAARMKKPRKNHAKK